MQTSAYDMRMLSFDEHVRTICGSPATSRNKRCMFLISDMLQPVTDSTAIYPSFIHYTGILRPTHFQSVLVAGFSRGDLGQFGMLVSNAQSAFSYRVRIYFG